MREIFYNPPEPKWLQQPGNPETHFRECQMPKLMGHYLLLFGEMS